MESLKRGLPEEIVLALNWSADRQFVFVVSSLSPPEIVPYPDEDIDETDLADAVASDTSDSRPPLDESVTLLPEMREREIVAVVEARNSVVAAWLLRNFLSAEHLRQAEILVNPCCQIIFSDSESV